MSVSVTYISEGNNIKGPSICAGGGLGIPDIEPRNDYNDDWGVCTYTFGWIYFGLSSIGLVTQEMEDFREFLEQNKENNIFMFVEGGEDPNEEKIDWDNIKPFKATDKPEFSKCSFIITNSSNGKSVQLNTGDQKLKPIDKHLSESEINNFINKIVDADMVDDSFHNTYGILFGYEELGQIKDFISENKNGNLSLEIKKI